MAKISVLLPVFNREQYLAQAITSILKQTYKEFELIIYNDGSTDKSETIIKNFMKRDSRIRLITDTKNHGIGYARNKLLEACQTEYACWQDSDDFSHISRLTLQYNQAKKIKGLVFTGWHWLHYHDKQWIRRIKNSDTLAFATLMFPVNKAIKFNALKIMGGEDWAWLKQMQKQYVESIIPKELYSVRFHHDRIGSWKRKLRKDLGGVFTTKQLETMSYAEALQKYKELKK